MYVTEDSVKSVITKMSSSSCLLDPQPTWLMKKCLMSNLPALTRIVNLSLQSGIFPADAHQAIVTPIIKKTSLDKEDVKSYRPVSNLSYVTKLIEKVVATQFVDHLSRNELNDSMQSAYRANSSTETALMKLQNDILSAYDVQRGVLVVLLDLTAAFDTTRSQLLLQLLQSRFHLSTVAHKWMRYIPHWMVIYVSAYNYYSEPWNYYNYGVPQGSVLGPVLFSAYLLYHSLTIIRKHGLSYIVYADDIQLYTTY